MKKLLIALLTLSVIAGAVTSIASTALAEDNIRPQFNIHTDSAEGDERDFVRVQPISSDGAYTDSIEMCSGQASVRIYIHNNAGEEHNGEDFDGPGVAVGTRLKFDASSLKASLGADNADPVSDTASITCDEHEIEIKPVSDALIWTRNGQNFVPLDNAVFSGGTAIGHETQNGIWPGCWEFIGGVYIDVEITPVEEPEPTPTPTPEPELACEVVHATVATKEDEATISTEVSATAKNAKVHSYTYAFNDPAGTSPTIINTDEAALDHKIMLTDEARTVTISVTTNFDTDDDNEADQTVTCNGSVDLPASPNAPTPAKCEIDGKEDLNADNADCKADADVIDEVALPTKEPDLPTTIASTGPAEQAVAFTSILALAGAVFYYRRSQVLSKFGL